MAEFQEVMKQFDRMCRYYQRKVECPMGCPMNGVNISQCRKIAFEEPKVTEQTVMQWAAEHPEPVYPTWGEWLLQEGVIRAGTETIYGYKYQCISDMMFESIPADIAQKLGLQPKEAHANG